MKKIITIGLILISNILYSQISHLNNRFKDIEIDWTKFEISMLDNEKEVFLNQFEETRINTSNEFYPRDFYLNTCHLIDIDNDFQLDIIQYYNEVSIGEKLTIYLNKNGKLEKIYDTFGKILFFNREITNSPIQIIQFVCTNSGNLTYSFDEIIISKSEGNNLFSLRKETILLYGETIIPEEQTIYIPFKVLNNKYKLRTEPKIDNKEITSPYNMGNTIAEFSIGDLGTAIAEKKDDTGRIWWFVVMNNNVIKDWNDYLHIDFEYENNRNMKIFGWISSRYLEKIK